MKRLKLFFACLLMAVLSIGQMWGGTWIEVTSEPKDGDNNTDWSGKYLIVFNEGCLNGSLTPFTDNSATIGVTIQDGKIVKDDSYSVTVAKSGAKYSLQTASGYYLGRNANSNGIDFNTTWNNNYTVVFNNWHTTNHTIQIAGNGSRCLGSNSSNNYVWRFFAGSNAYTKLSLYQKAVNATSNNTNFGTVSVSNDVITATPETGYRVSTSNPYTISPTGKATVSQSDNVFTLTNVTAVVTLTVNFEVDAPDFSITPATNDEDKGTVSLTGNIITASPKSGYRIDEDDAYTVTSGTATVTRGTGEHINEFTVTPTSDCTVQINFKAIPTHTIHFNTGGLVDIADATEIKEGDTYNITQTPAASLTTHCEYGTFVGWTTANSIADASVKPTIITSYQMSTSDITLHAVYSKTTPSAGPSGSVTITHESTNFPETYAAADYNLEGYTFNIKQIYKNGKMQWRSSTNGAGAGVIYNKSTFPAKISSIVLTYTGDSQTYNHVLHVGNEANPTSGTEISGTTDENVVTYDCSGSNADYFVLANGEGAGYTSSLVINYGSAGTTTYSLDANCCTPLNVNIAAGITNGSVSADPASACEGATVTLTFTPSTNYHLSGWTLNGTAQDIAVNTFTMPNAAVTVSATFAEDACTPLGTPSVSASDKTYPYDAVKLAWTAIEHANKYKVYIYDNDDNELEHNDEFTGTEYTIGQTLSGGTTYKYSVQAISNTPATYCSSTEAEGTFTTDALPTHTVNWYVNGTLITANSKTDVVGTAVTAPTDFSTFTDCSDLHFVGWAESAIEGGSSTEAPTTVTPITAIGTTDKNYYAVFAAGTPGSTTNKFTETFAASTGTAGWSGNCSNGTISYDNTGWTADKAYGNGGSAKFGTGSARGWATTPEITVTGNATLTFKSGAWSGDKTTGGLVLSATGATLSETTFDLTDSNWDDYEVAINGATGTVQITFSAAQDSKNRFYLEDVIVSQTSASNFSMYYTTCPSCNSVSFTKAGQENGCTFELQRNSAEVSAVNTCEATSVNVVASPATGYELTDIALSGVDGATYDADVISIPANASGELTVTATFSPVNYTVNMAQAGGADATISGNQTNKHYGDEITVTAEAKEGYVFSGWTASPAVEFANAKALSTTFDMPNNDVTITANFTQVYSVTDFLAISDKGDAAYCIEGIVSYVKSLDPTQYTNAQYYISASGQRTNEVYIYNGKYVDGADFTSVDQLHVGDKVVVCGTWSSTHSSINQNNYLISRIEGQHQSYEIIGELGKTTFQNGDLWLDSYMSGLSVNDIYNTGYVIEVEDVTFEANKANNDVLSTSDEQITVTAKKNTATLTSKNFDITVSDATLQSYVLKAGYKTEYYVGEQFVKPTIIGTLSNDQEIEEVATSCSGQNMNAAGEYTVTVTYTYGTVTLNDKTYTINVKNVGNDNAHPYTVAEARNIIDIDRADGNNLALSDAGNKVYVQGIVTSVTNNEIKINVDANDDQPLSLWKYILGKNFETNEDIDDVETGETIIAYGNLLFFESQYTTKYELDEDCEVVWKEPTAMTGVTLTATKTVKVGKSVTLVPTFEPANATNKNVTWTIVSGDDKITLSNAGVVTGEAEGEAVVQVETEDGHFTATCTITVTAGVNFNNGVWQLVTDASTLSANDYLVIVSNATGKEAIAGDISSQIMASENVAFSADKKYIQSLPNNAVILTLGGTSGAWTLANENDKLLGATAQGKLAWDNGTTTWSISITDNNATIQNGTNSYGRFLYNANSPRFTTYTSATNTSMLLPQLYRFTTTLEDYTRSVTNGNFGTICLPYAGTISGATLFELSGKDADHVYVDELGTSLEAGKPYVFLASADQITVTYNAFDYTEPSASGYKGLHGTFVDLSGNDLIGTYLISNNQYYNINTNDCSLNAYRAYFMYDEIDQINNNQMPVRRRFALGNGAPQVATGVDTLNASETPVKMIIDGQMYILRGEKLFDATGRLVK